MLTDDLKNRAIIMGVDLVGIAPVDRFKHAPDLKKPQYYMPDARSVVVLATRIMEGLCDVHGSYEEEGKTIGPYMWHGYVMLNWANSWVAIQVAKLLEDSGYKAFPFPPTGYSYRTPDQGSDFSHRHAAVAAGLGEFGLNGLLITPQFGAHQRVISIITNAPLDPDPMYGGPELCRREECGDLCINMCPLNAFEDKMTSVRIGDRVFEYAVLSRAMCIWSGLGGKYLRGTEELPRYPTQEQIEELITKAGGRPKLLEKMNPSDKALQQFAFAPSCGACLTKCIAPFV